MNIFEKRPLALVLCIGLGGFFLFTFDNPLIRLILIASAFLPLIISLILRFDHTKKTLSKIVTLSLIISFTLSFLYFDRWFAAYEIYEDEVNVIGTVEELSATNSYTTRLLVKVESINGEDVRGYKFYAYSNKSDAKGIVYGTRISFKASMTGFSEESRSYNISRGINAYASDLKDLTILEYTDGGISGKLAHLKEVLTRYTILISDRDSGAILSALLFGERDYLPDQLRLDFKRIGISHILALSGMHLAFLSLALEKLLSLMKIGKKYRLAITAVFVFLYMAITGFSVSVVRAGIMVILSSLLFLLSRSKDSLTSLSVAVFIICLITPYAIFDISLQLSALSTFGIIAFSEFTAVENPMKNRGRILKYLYSGVLASVFAISATIWISTTTFGGFSIIAPFATLLFSFIVELVMNLGCIMLLVGWFIPIGKLLSPLCFLISDLSARLSSIKWSYVSSNFRIVSILIIIYTVCFFAFMISRLKNPGHILNGLLILFISILIVPTAISIYSDRQDTTAYSSEYKCDEFIIRSEREICLINSSQYSKAQAYGTLDFLEELKITYLDKYYLTHYSWSIDEDLDVLLSSVLVEKIFIPAPRNEDEETILKVIYKATEDYRTQVIVFDENKAVTVGDYEISLLHSAPYGETSVNAFTVSNGSKRFTYFSSGSLTEESYSKYKDIISVSDNLIFGSHGKKYKDNILLNDYYDSLESIIINSDNFVVTQECAEVFEENECEIIYQPENIIYLK